MNAHVPSKAAWIDGAIGALLGFAWPIGEGAHAGGALSHLFSAMGLYFTLIGLGAGMLSGFFRAGGSIYSPKVSRRRIERASTSSP